MAKKNEFAKNILTYSIASYLYTAINAISNIFVSNILGPTANGIISYFNAINSNIDKVIYSTLRSSVERTVPQIDDLEKQIEYAQNAFTLNIYSSIIVSIGFVIYGLCASDYIIQISAYFMSIFNLVHAISEFYRTWNRSLNKIKMVSIVMILVALLIPVCSILFSLLFGIYGFWSGRVVLQLVALFVFLFFTKETIRYCRLQKDVVRKIIISGGEIVVFSFFTSAFHTIDKYFVKAFVGLESLGYYSVGAMVFTMLMLVPHSVTGAVYPKFVSMVNRNLFYEVKKYSVYIVTVCIAVSLLVFILAPTLIELFMPKYTQSVPIIRILLIAFVSYSSVQLPYIDIIRKKKVPALIKNCTVSFIITLIAFFIVSYQQPSIAVYAWCNVLGFCLLAGSIIYTWQTMYEIKKSNTKFLEILEFFAPAIIMSPLYLALPINTIFKICISIILLITFVAFKILIHK